MAALKRASAKAGKRGGKRVEAGVGKKAAARAPAKQAAVAKASRPVTKVAAVRGERAKPAKKAPKKATPAKPSKLAKAAAPREPSRPVKAAAVAKPGTGGPAEGDRAPSFALQDQRGQLVSSGDLAGKPYVIYFYPKNDTPGCTTEACGFRDTGAQFDGAGVRVVGVSPDSVASHQRFASKYGLPFTLLSDPKQELASQYGVWALKKNYGREYMGIVRSTFLVDAEGVVRKAWRSVRVNGHVAAVQAAAAVLS